jgi:hypothetical protein
MRWIATIAAFVALGCAACTSSSSGTPAPSSPAVSTVSVSPTSPASSSSFSGPPRPSTPAVPADVPTTGPNTRAGEKPPVMPLEATQHTARGAKAFAAFFIQTIDWGYATTSSAYMRHYFEQSCVQCRNAAMVLDNARRMHDHYVGGRITIRQLGPIGAGGPNRSEYTARLRLDIDSVEVLTSSGHAKNPDHAHLNYGQSLGVRWSVGRWTVVYGEGR